MSFGYFTPRPPVWRAVLWDGSNLAEVEQVFSGYTVVDNQDGTVTVSFMTGDRTFESGSWLTEIEGTGVLDETLFQQLPDSGPATYVMS